MLKIFILQGLPAAGKSTWATQYVKDNLGTKRINNDSLRLMLDNGVFSRDNEDMLNVAFFQLVTLSLNSGFDVILDNTYLNQKALNKVHAFASNYGNLEVIEKVFPVSIEDCLARNALREGLARVPEKVIFDMAKAAGIDKNGYAQLLDKVTTYRPKPEAKPQDTSLPKALVCDLDGTLALIGDRSPYDSASCAKDHINTPVLECLHAMYLRGYEIIFVSGRSEDHRLQTKEFLDRCNTITTDMSESTLKMYYSLFMRPSKDNRKDSVVKKEIYENHLEGRYNILFWLDDRPQVIRMARYDLGLTVFALNDREF